MELMAYSPQWGLIFGPLCLKTMCTSDLVEVGDSYRC